MSDIDTTIELDFETNGKRGVGTLRALCGDDVLANEHVDLLDRTQRDDFIGRLCDLRPGIDRESLEQKLLQLSVKPTKPTAAIAKPTRPTPLWEPFPLDALPMILRDFIGTHAESMGCDPSMIALPAIATLAGAIGTTRQICLKRASWYEYPIVWTAVVARSGTLKSPALDEAVRTIRKEQERRFEEHDDAMVEHEATRNRYDAELADWKRKPTNGAERGGVPTKPIEPTCVRYLVSDATVESLVPILAANQRGILLCRDELGGWLQSFNQYKGGKGADLQNWLEMHRGGPIVVDRVTRGTIRASRAAVSVTGTIQPGTLAQLLTPEFFESGLSARFLLAAPPSKLKHWTDAVPNQSALDTFDSIIGTLIQLEHDADGGSVALPMMAGARAEYVRFYNSFAKEQADADDDAQAASFAKIEGYVPRLALVFALTDDPHAGKVGADSMRSAITVGRWFARESQRVYGMLREKPEEREGRELVEWIRKRGGSASVRDLQRGPRRYRESNDAAAALEGLVRAGHGRWEMVNAGATGGAPSKRFRLNEPSGDGDNSPTGAIEKEGTVTVASVGALVSETEGVGEWEA